MIMPKMSYAVGSSGTAASKYQQMLLRASGDNSMQARTKYISQPFGNNNNGGPPINARPSLGNTTGRINLKKSKQTPPSLYVYSISA